MNEGQIALVVGVLLAAGLAASLAAGRLRVPGLVLVLGLGMLIGSDGLSLISFDDFGLARSIGVVLLAFILFEGGLSAGFDEIRPVLATSIALATLGTLGTAALTAVAAGLLFGQLSTLEALMLGSTVAATDAAAIFAVLRGSTLRRRLARTLEGESGINDPIAVLLVLGCIEALDDPLLRGRGRGPAGAAGALDRLRRRPRGGGRLGAFLRRVRLPSAGLYPVASIATGALAFGAAQSLHGSGFLAVFLAGLVLGTASTPARRTITTFHEGLAWVAQLGLFLTLGLLVFPDRLDDVALKGAAIAIVTAVFARPIAAVLATVFSGFSVRERLMLGWAGLRGATPIVFATFPVTAGIHDGELIFDVAFFVVLLSTVLQGTTIEPVARWLGVTSEEAALPAPLVEPVLLNRLGAEVVQFPVREHDAVVGHPVRELGLPREALLNVIVRGDRAIPPRGSTIIEAGDQLHMIVRQEVAVEFQDVMRMWRAGPLEAHKRPRPRVLSRPAVTSVRPWTEADGDPSRPAEVSGQEVVDQLRTRRDEPGALVALADGRFAVTGRLLAVGPSGELQAVARRRLARAETAGDRAWWQEVVGALAR